MSFWFKPGDSIKNLITTRWLLFFFVLLKRRRFDFKKIDPDDPVTRSKPRTWALDRAGSKNYVKNTLMEVEGKKKKRGKKLIQKCIVVVKKRPKWKERRNIGMDLSDKGPNSKASHWIQYTNTTTMVMVPPSRPPAPKPK